MSSKTQLFALVKEFAWKPIQATLRDAPDFLAITDQRGRNLLHLCCSVNPKARKLKPAESIRTAGVLLDAGLDINKEAFSEGAWKATPLWYAISRGENLALAKYLLRRGASPEHCLWAAAYRNDLEAIRLLLASGARIDAVAEDETPFLFAIKWSRFRAAELLLSKGADANFQDKRGMTALHYMLKKGSSEHQLRMVIKHGARGDIPDNKSATAMQIISRKRAPSVRKIAKMLQTNRTGFRS